MGFRVIIVALTCGDRPGSYRVLKCVSNFSAHPLWFVYAHFFRADFTATNLRQYDFEEFDFHLYDTTFNYLSDDGTLKGLRTKLPELNYTY